MHMFIYVHTYMHTSQTHTHTHVSRIHTHTHTNHAQGCTYIHTHIHHKHTHKCITHTHTHTHTNHAQGCTYIHTHIHHKHTHTHVSRIHTHTHTHTHHVQGRVGDENKAAADDGAGYGTECRPHSEKSVPSHIYCIKAHKEDFSEWVPEDEHAISVVRVVRHRPQRYEQHHLFQRKKRKKEKKEKNRTKNKNLSQTKRKQNLDKKKIK